MVALLDTLPMAQTKASFPVPPPVQLIECLLRCIPHSYHRWVGGNQRWVGISEEKDWEGC